MGASFNHSGDSQMTIKIVTLSFDGSDSVQFVDNIATHLAEVMEFGDHGTLNEDERAAFVWGFRYGIYNMISLLEQAGRRGNKEFVSMSRIFTEAMDTWDLKGAPEIAAMFPVVDPDKETP
jgi:hypothetical protein